MIKLATNIFLTLFLCSCVNAATFKARSCVDFPQAGSKVAQKTVYDVNDQPYNVLCYYDGLDIYTLIESFNKTNSLHSKIAASFAIDTAVNEDTSSSVFPLDLYRLSKARMEYLASKSTMFMSSCNVVINPNQFQSSSVGHDYIKGTLDQNSKRLFFESAWLTLASDNCLSVSGNVFGASFSAKSIPVFSRNDIHLHMSVDESKSYCDKHDLLLVSEPAKVTACGVSDYPPGAPATANLFGSYNKCTKDFSCSGADGSITSWWLGSTAPPIY
ncbi:hypothetical protein TrispH2_010982 [Trichoplax sp. H2]|uniref:Uncharacterized protein n=1 Tax=Trichoplax adhaerens TaxID=10228 RepID=B3RMH2_TRIAD|nr:predicted protein [Trichoplax adhaerens]EDV28365.1 predicted protein [Trichoplax adhaerens]RDD37093.1 hypothetical protein TrispH2_010982 [Trichoplax sp. H2]|eukprot:XP_002110199.1 predicted protein [Trichoplax adhaerens]